VEKMNFRMTFKRKEGKLSEWVYSELLKEKEDRQKEAWLTKRLFAIDGREINDA
jgi:hypothetical protein